MLTNTTMVLSAAILFGLAVPADAKQRPVHHQAGYGYALGIPDGVGAAAVQPFTPEEKALFDRASRSSPL
jgi:hypothetical protein